MTIGATCPVKKSPGGFASFDRFSFTRLLREACVYVALDYFLLLFFRNIQTSVNASLCLPVGNDSIPCITKDKYCVHKNKNTVHSE